ncbi:MAG: ABC transporter permease [Ruminococcus sp.]|nr:ABC transporter permease [Oscillospiraceae bacterium]MBP3309968.1 ABC transporter permease [Ruminococcus sp.]
MYLNILKKDLKRKKTMNVILLLFVILATMFAASGLNNVFTVVNGTDYYLDKAEIGDFAVITMGDNSTGNADGILAEADCITSYKIETCIFGSQDSIKRADGTDVETKNTPLFQSISDAKLKFFDTSNQPVFEVSQGEVMIAGNFIGNNNFNVGDNIRIKLGDVQMELKIAGRVKDAFLGSDFMGNTRFLLNQTDYDKFLADEMIKAHYQGEVIYIETDDVTATISAISDIPGIAFSGARSTLEMCYVMEMIVAFVVLILSICLIIVSFVVLRFSIGFTISEEYREIGVMKAIGIKNHKIRGLYIAKYLLMSLIGGSIGLFASIPFGNMLLMSVSENMVLGNDAGLLINLVSAVGTMIIILLFAYSCTGKVKKLTPIDAIRSGQTGERFGKKSCLRIGRTNARPAFFMAVNDILSAPKRFMTIMISFFLCTLFVLMLVNTVSTMKSPNLITTFGTESDLYITDVNGAMELQSSGDKNTVADELKKLSDKITAEGMPCDVSVDIQYKYKVISSENDFSISCAQSVNIPVADYDYFEGTAPQNKNEIAVTPYVSEMIGAKIGDTVTIDFGTEKLNCIVTAYFQTMNNLGELIRLHDDAPTDMSCVSAIRQFQVDFTDDPSEKEIETRKEKIKKLLDNDDVMTATEYCIDCVSVVPTMEAVKLLLLTITIVVVILVTVLVERSFISDERSQIALLKAIGFRNSSIISWNTLRFGIVALAAAILAAAASIPMTDLCITPVFGMMGASKIEFNIDPLQIFLLYPAVIFAVTILAAWLTSLYTGKIKSSDTSNIE